MFQKPTFPPPPMTDSELIFPGSVVTSDPAYMRGHGTYTENESILSSVLGSVHRTNKLITVKPVYSGEIGDLVVGRIINIGNKRWKVDLGCRSEVQLLLAAVNLPGGELRKRSENDELHMRSLLDSGDLISAEIQASNQDGSWNLHTRSLKYGKLRNGRLVVVPARLIKRQKTQFAKIGDSVECIIGLNGWIWVHAIVENVNADDNIYSNENDEISDVVRMEIAKIGNSINLLAKCGKEITESTIVHVLKSAVKSKTMVSDIEYCYELCSGLL